MKKLVPILLALCLLLAACGVQEAAPTTAAPTTEPTTVPTTAAPTTEPAPRYYHPLTGLPLEEPMTARPVTVVTNNLDASMPHHGTSQADIIYEILAEGGITRCLAVYTDLASVGEIGSIRSARTYFISLSKIYDAVLIHSGDSVYARDKFYSGDYPHVDGYETLPFYRNQSRLASGYSLEHTLFTTGEGLFAYLDEYFNMVTDKKDYGLIFADGSLTTGEKADTVTITYSLGGKTTRFLYDSERNAYSVYQHKRDYVDGNTGEKVYFSNVIVMYAAMRTVKSGHVFHTLEGENTG